MTDTPKDRDDEAMREVIEKAVCSVDRFGLKYDFAAILPALRSAGYLVARPVADEGLREAITAYGVLSYRLGCISSSSTQKAIDERAAARTHLEALIHAREAALRAERDAAQLSEDKRRG